MDVRARRAREAFCRWEQVFAIVRMEGMAVAGDVRPQTALLLGGKEAI